MNKFVGESINASFDKKPSKNLHKKKQQRLDSYNRNNARNRDVWTKAKAMGNALYIEDLSRGEIKSIVEGEAELILKLDHREDLENTDNSGKRKRNNSK